MKSLILALALGSALAVVQPQAAAAQSAAAAKATIPIDSERLSLARQSIDFIWPLGTYERMMSGPMDQMMDQMMGSVFDTKLKDVVGADGKEMSEEDRKVAETTMRDAIARKDPHFEERMRITNQVMMAEIGGVMTKVEPAVREGLANAYAKKFTGAQLRDLNAFFATPTGRVYAAESMMLYMDPEVMKSMMAMLPEFMKAMPGIEEKMKKATAHLPQPPKDEETEEEAEAQDSTA